MSDRPVTRPTWAEVRGACVDIERIAGRLGGDDGSRLLRCRVLVVTDLLEQGVPLDVQTLVGHSQPQTTARYDRRERRIARSVVKRIAI